MEPEDTNPNQGQTLPPQQPVQTPMAVQQPPAQSAPKLTERAEKLKRLCIQIMIGGLICAAALAVIAVLVGSFNETFVKALFTLFLVFVHALACLAFVERTGRHEKSSFRFFENVVFTIIVLSFFTSIFGVWGILAGSIVAKLYGTYFILAFASLHGQMLVETRGIQDSIDNIINFNYVMMSLVVLLILPIIWSGSANFPSFYYRLLAACGIIDATLTILAVILNRLYIQKHPEIRSTVFTNIMGAPTDGASVSPIRRVHPLVWLLGLFIVGQFVVSILFAALGAFYHH